MALDGLITGASTRVVFSNPDTVIVLTGLSEFSPRQEANVLREYEITGEVHLPFIPTGWSGRATFLRLDDSMDRYMALQESLYYSALNQSLATMYQTITEQDGSQTQIQYVGCVLTIPDGGNFSAQNVVKYTIDMQCKRKLVLN